MTHSFDIVAYTYRADNYTPAGVVSRLLQDGGLDYIAATHVARAVSDVEAWLNNIAAKHAIDREDERSFDSGEFPKVIFADQVEDPEETFATETGEYVTAHDLGLA